MNFEELPPEAVNRLIEFDRLARAGEACVPPADVIAELVKLQRAMLNLKQEALASLAGVSLSTIERIERGERVSTESLDRVAIVLGNKPGDFTRPRVPLTAEQVGPRIAASMARFDNNEMVPVRPLRTQPQIAAFANTHMALIDGGRIDHAFAGHLATLQEMLDLTGFAISIDERGTRVSGEPLKRRRLYKMALDLIGQIERDARAVALGGIYTATTGSKLMPTVHVAVIGFFPRSSDPGALKRRFLLAPKIIDLAAAVRAFVDGNE